MRQENDGVRRKLERAGKPFGICRTAGFRAVDLGIQGVARKPTDPYIRRAEGFSNLKFLNADAMLILGTSNSPR